MQMSFWCTTKNLKHIHNLVKRYDGRYVYNPMLVASQANVVLTFADMDNANKFNLMQHITEQPYF